MTSGKSINLRAIKRLRRLRAKSIATLVPRRSWYRVALALSRIEALLEPSIPYKASAGGTAARLQSWIKDLSRLGSFPIPLRSEGIELVGEALASSGSGVMFCGTHVPLNDMLLRVLADAGITCVTVSHPDSLIAGRYPIPATGASVEAVLAGPNALLGVRRVLRRGDSIFHLLDENVDGPLHDNALRLIGKISAPLLAWSVELAADGTIEVRIEPYPYPSCGTEAHIRANVIFAQARRSRWRHSLAKHSS